MSKHTCEEASKHFVVRADAFVAKVGDLAASLPPNVSEELHLAVDHFRTALDEFREHATAQVSPPVPVAPNPPSPKG